MSWCLVTFHDVWCLDILTLLKSCVSWWVLCARIFVGRPPRPPPRRRLSSSVGSPWRVPYDLGRSRHDESQVSKVTKCQAPWSQNVKDAQCVVSKMYFFWNQLTSTIFNNLRYTVPEASYVYSFEPFPTRISNFSSDQKFKFIRKRAFSATSSFQLLTSFQLTPGRLPKVFSL